MNSKIFALLLILPVAFFATDKLTGLGTKDGGGKAKRKIETPQLANVENGNVSLPQDKPAEAEQPLQNVSENSAKVSNSIHEATAIAEIQALMQALKSADSEYNTQSASLLYLHQAEVGKTLSEWIDKNVQGPLSESNPEGVNLQRSFSRCPSGYRAALASENGKPTNEGWMIVDDGCWDRPIAQFRYDVIANTVEAKVGEKTGYVPLSAFFALYKAAKA